MTEYSITAAQADVAKRRGQFQQLFEQPPGFNWKDVDKNASRDSSKDDAPRLVECDLYVRSAGPMPLPELFKDCADAVVSLVPPHTWESATASAPSPIVLCEVAETRESMRGKLWQLERAMQFGPSELQRPTACCVCLNGERPLFDLAAELAQAALRKQGDVAWRLASVPVFALWTPYRNVYAEIKSVNRRLDGVEKRLDGVEKRLDRVEKRLDGLEKSAAENGEKLDLVIAMLSRKP